MRSLNIFTYVSTIAVSLSYFLPSTLHPACAAVVAVLGLATVPVAERMRIRACERAAQVARASGADDAHDLARRVALQAITEARGSAAPPKEQEIGRVHQVSTD